MADFNFADQLNAYVALGFPREELPNFVLLLMHDHLPRDTLMRRTVQAIEDVMHDDPIIQARPDLSRALTNCVVCTLPIHMPVVFRCNHVVCANCVSTIHDMDTLEPKCPLCRRHIVQWPNVAELLNHDDIVCQDVAEAADATADDSDETITDADPDDDSNVEQDSAPSPPPPPAEVQPRPKRPHDVIDLTGDDDDDRAMSPDLAMLVSPPLFPLHDRR